MIPYTFDFMSIKTNEWNFITFKTPPYDVSAPSETNPISFQSLKKPLYRAAGVYRHQYSEPRTPHPHPLGRPEDPSHWIISISIINFEAGQLLLALLEALAEVFALQPVPLHAARQLLVAVADLVGEALRRAAPNRTAARFSENKISWYVIVTKGCENRGTKFSQPHVE